MHRAYSGTPHRLGDFAFRNSAVWPATIVTLALVIICAWAVPSQAQIHFTPNDDLTEDSGIASICHRFGTLAVVKGDDCDSELLEPNLAFAATSLVFGGASTITFNSNGTAVFGAGTTTTFAGTTIFNSLTNFAGGITTTSFTASGAAQFNGDLNVAANKAVNFNGNRLQGVGAPIAGTDAANKQYVDDQNAAQNTVINTHTSQISSLQNENVQQQTQINNNISAITGLQNQNSQQQEEIATLFEQNYDQQIQINSNTADILALQSDVSDLQDRDDELAEGIAISLALEAPNLRPGQTFAMRGGWGNFDGTSAIGFSAAGAINNNFVVDAGVGWGTRRGTAAGKAGVTIGW